MSLLDEVIRSYALRKLTGMFEAFAEPAAGAQYLRNTQAIGRWLNQLQGSSPQQITHTLFKQMKEARRRGDVRRFNAQTVLLELLVEEDVTLVGLAEGGEVNGMTLDDVDRMTVRELRVALRESRETAEAKDKVIADKNKKVDELAEKLAKKQTGAKEPKAEDVGSDLLMMLSSLEVSIRSQVSRLKELFDQLNAHREAHGINHTAKMVGTLNQIILDCETLRENYALPTEAPTDDVPEWLADVGNTEN